MSFMLPNWLKRRSISDREVLLAADILMSEGNDERQIEMLTGAGIELAAAHRLATFLPLAFARPVIEEFGGLISDQLSIPVEGGHAIRLLSRQPEYVASLRLARRHRSSPC